LTELTQDSTLNLPLNCAASFPAILPSIQTPPATPLATPTRQYPLISPPHTPIQKNQSIKNFPSLGQSPVRTSASSVYGDRWTGEGFDTLAGVFEPRSRDLANPFGTSLKDEGFLESPAGEQEPRRILNLGFATPVGRSAKPGRFLKRKDIQLKSKLYRFIRWIMQSAVLVIFASRKGSRKSGWG
jgi:hypothetical protein